jgi:pimeloyl-ACP methyl ester carboxylesterase
VSAAGIERGRRPPLLWLAIEGRALLEAAVLPLHLPLLMSAPRGDGHPVLVLPGLLAGDGTTWPLRRYLRSRGHAVHGWQLGRNLGLRDGVLQGLRARLAELHEAAGERVSLVGWSLGGLYARELARETPERVRQVISLGSPMYGNPRRTTHTWLAYRLLRGRAALRDDIRGIGAPPVPTTSVYSRSDGVVGWRTCVEQPGAQVQNVQTPGSHSGLGFNALVLYLVADRLAQPEHEWRPFEPPMPLRPFYKTTP